MNRPKPLLLVYAQDAGGARAILPVVKELISRGCYHIHILTHRFAGNIFRREGMASIDLGQVSMVPLNAQSANQLLVQLNPCGVFCGTSSQSDPSNGELIRAAREAKVPCFALMDHWKGWDRFRSHRGVWDYLPTLLGVIDEVSRQQATKSGIPPSSICIVGHPHLEALFQAGPSMQGNLREKWRFNPDDFVCTLFTQPIVEGEGERRTLHAFLAGERAKAMEGIIRALNESCSRRGLRLRMLIKPHPREIVENLRGEAVGIQIVREEDSLDVALSSDLVIGIDSMSLYEAHIAGASVVGLRLDPFHRESSLPEESPAFFPVVRSNQEFSDFISNFEWEGRLQLPIYPLPKGAVTACCEALDNLVKSAGITREEIFR